jgi:DUF438 domain-containing protein
VVSHDNKVVVFNKDGDAIMSRSTRLLGNAVKDACGAIATDWRKQVIKANRKGATPDTADAASTK